jgi:hypothetical protein
MDDREMSVVYCRFRAYLETAAVECERGNFQEIVLGSIAARNRP